jgi:hypothetical protein
MSIAAGLQPPVFSLKSEGSTARRQRHRPGHCGGRDAGQGDRRPRHLYDFAGMEPGNTLSLRNAPAGSDLSLHT